MKEDPVLNAPVASLQTMLRTIAFYLGKNPAVAVDGIFGKNTEAAVTEFQQANRLPVTGVADAETFRMIVRACNQANEALSPAEPRVSLFPSNLQIQPGQDHPNVALAQSMFNILRKEFPDFQRLSQGGLLDDKTATNLKLLQAFSGLEPTGILDKQTWNRLSQLYRGTFDRALPPSQG